MYLLINMTLHQGLKPKNLSTLTRFAYSSFFILFFFLIINMSRLMTYHLYLYFYHLKIFKILFDHNIKGIHDILLITNEYIYTIIINIITFTHFIY